MREGDALLEVLALIELYDFNLSEPGRTSLLTSGRKEPMANRKGYCGLLENPREKIFQGAE